ncbi:MAG: hypothetical protein GC160_22950 [Acidobacteria bacterium]|nr:hypothetical protein [Acidobacteriota bacterium]
MRALTPFNQNPCGSIGRASTDAPAPTQEPQPSPAPAEPAPSSPTAPTTPPTPATASNTVTCDYGRVVYRTPFNPNPCAVAAPAEPKEVPDDFLLVFGGDPPATGLALEDRLAQEVLHARFDSFVTSIAAPDSFQDGAAAYERWGLGEPVFYRDSGGERVRWPSAAFEPAEAALADAVERPDAVVAAWQTRVILRGGVLPELHPDVPANVAKLHEARVSEEPGDAPDVPAILTWASTTQAAAALHEPGPDLAAWGLSSALSSPARPGDWVRLYVAGLAADETVSVLLGGVRLAPEDFSVLELAGGLHCLAFQIPANANSGDQQVYVETARASSQPGPYLSVER